MPRAAKSVIAPAARSRTTGGDPGIVAPIPATVTPASEIDALTGDPNFMSSLARGLAVIRGSAPSSVSGAIGASISWRLCLCTSWNC